VGGDRHGRLVRQFHKGRVREGRYKCGKKLRSLRDFKNEEEGPSSAVKPVGRTAIRREMGRLRENPLFLVGILKQVAKATLQNSV